MQDEGIEIDGPNAGPHPPRRRRTLAPARLWVRLSLVYAGLALIGMAVSMVAAGMILEWRSRSTAMDDALVRSIAAPYVAPIDAVAGRSGPEAAVARDALLDGLRQALLAARRHELDDRDPAFDAFDGAPTLALALLLPEGGAPSAPDAAILDAMSDGRVVVTFPLSGGRSLLVAFDAPYDVARSFADHARFVMSMAPMLLLFYGLTGLVGGVVAARYVTRRLDRIDRVAAAWQSGQFDRMIDVTGSDELERHALQLNEMATDLQMHLNLRQAVAVAEERSRIAGDLHDTVKQKLFALALQLAVVERKDGAGDGARGDLAGNVREAQEITREAQSDLMEVITQLRSLDRQGSTLGEQLRTMADGYARRLGVEIALSGFDAVAVRPRTELHLGRIAQEAISNAVRHGRARRIEVGLTASDAMLAMRISDDGRGFDPDATPGGLGLSSIRQRVSELPEGEVAIASAPGAGCTITIRWRRARGAEEV